MQVSQKIRNLAGQLQELGLKKGDKLSVFSENSYKWLLLDGATLKCGAANVVRGAGATKEELVYIYNDSESKACVLQTEELLQKLISEKGGILSSEVDTTPEFFIVIDAGKI